jgi:isoleucyl-tRNA synthetase
MYQNLVRSVAEESPLSVHLADWPEYDPARIDDELNREMALVMKLASLGHAARNKANRKVRQPLAEAAFAVGNVDELSVPGKYSDLLIDELNVKSVRVLGQAGEAVSYSLNPLPKQLGQKYGRLFPAIRQAVLGLEPTVAAQALLAGQPVSVQVGDETYPILPEELEVRMQARSGYAVASEGAYLAALVTELTPDLVREGLAREFVRRLQDLRKTAGLEISDRIRVVYDGTEGLNEAVSAFRDYIMAETLTVELSARAAGEGMAVVSDAFDGEQVSIGLVRV